MRRLTTLALTILTVLVIIAPEAPKAAKTIEAPIDHVTVYLDRAQITRLANLELPSGEHTVAIENLPVGIIDQSFRASISDMPGLTLIGLKHRLVRHVEDPHEKIAELEKAIYMLLNNDRKELEGRLESFSEQKKIVLNISKSSGSWTAGDSGKVNLDVQSWRTAFNFIGSSLQGLNDSIRVISNLIADIDKNVAKIKAELRDLGAGKERLSKTVEIDLMLETPLSFDLALKYNIGNASWNPVYDVRLDNDTSIQMICYASITQRTGENWNNVNMTVSTAMPSQSTSPGDLRSWYLQAIEQYPSAKSDALSYFELNSNDNVDELLRQTAGVVSNSDGEILIRGGRAGEESYIVDRIGIPASIRENNFSFAFDCRHKKTVLSGNESEKTLIAEWNLESELTYLCRPRLNMAVYRLAKATNQGESPLLPGEVSIFADGDFIGQALLREFIAPSEEFEVGFGLDNNFKVERKILAVKNSTGGGIFSDDKIISEQTIEIRLTNNYRDRKTVKIDEALPVSQDERIKVKFGDIIPAYGSMDKEGIATWSLDLESAEEQIISIPVKIEHEKDISVAGL